MFAGSLLGTLSACGGDGGGSGSDAPADVTAPVSPPPSTPAGPTVKRTLMIDIDGATYDAVQSGIGNGTLPNLAKLQIQLAYSGGVSGTPSQQPNLDTPGWATLLTGTWTDRHQVISDAPKQAMHSSTVFQMSKAVGTGLNGAAVASTGLAQLLSADRSAGYLDTLTDCSQNATASDCVTNQAVQLIDSNYSTVVAQYHSPQDAAINFGLRSSQYGDTLAQLDKAVGTLVTETAKASNTQWLIVVTGNHGLSANSQDDGLPLVPESTTFVGLNQTSNNGTQGIGATVPAALSGLYGYASIADVAPTLLGYLTELPSAATNTIDGGDLIGAPSVSQLVATVSDNNSSSVSVTLNWVAPANGAITVLRNGQVIASSLPAGTATYTDNQLSQVLTAQGTFELNYTVQVGDAASAASRSTLTPPVTYVPPVPLATTLTNGLVTYYPFSASLPPVDALGHSTMAPYATDLPAAAGMVLPGPFVGGNGLQIDTNFVDTNGFEGYKLTPASGFDISQGTAPQFTIGFWFKVPSCIAASDVPVLSNKNYFSGGNDGVAIGMFASTANQCGIAFNVGSGGPRADGPTSPFTQITVNRWVYIAFAVDGVAKTMNMNVYDSVTGVENKVAVGKSTGTVNLALLSPFPQWGIGEDGTGRYLMNKCGDMPPYTAGKCTIAPTYQEMFGDLAMWNRVLTETELQSIFRSNKPLSTLLAN